MCGVQKSAFHMLWEYLPSSVNLASDWLRKKRVLLWKVEKKESSPVDVEEIKIKMDNSVDTSLASEGIDLFVDLWEAQPCLWDPE